MSQTIRITAGDVSVLAELNDSATARAIAEALSIHASGNRWGDEIYFVIPVNETLADGARDEMDVGELAYWPPGNAFCIFFGATPASRAEEPRAASPVNPVGRVLDDATTLREVPDGADVVIEQA